MSFVFNRLFWKHQYVNTLLVFNVYAGMCLFDKYGVRIITCHGPSMVPTIDKSDNIMLVDSFTTTFLREPRKGEIILVDNPFKDATLVKRVLYTETEMAEFYSKRTDRIEKVYVPPGHVWIEGDNKDHSKDSRDFGPISICAVQGVVRARLWPPHRIQSMASA